MLRAKLQQRAEAEQETRIEMSPLIDIVFILLIFFIVSTVFVRETGVEVDKPSAAASEELQDQLVILAVTADGDVVHAGTNIGLIGIRATIAPLLESPDDPVLIQADATVSTQQLVRVIDQLQQAGADNVLLATRNQP